MQEKPKLEEGSGKSQENQQEKKKRKRRKKKKTNATNQASTGVKALREDLDPSELFADSDQSEDEGIADYKIGGYHPVHIGEVMVERYVILQKLGWGHFSTVWLARDLRHSTYVAVKV
jgi:serine/threonine-protein kinase SRPK3